MSPVARWGGHCVVEYCRFFRSSFGVGAAGNRVLGHGAIVVTTCFSRGWSMLMLSWGDRSSLDKAKPSDLGNVLLDVMSGGDGAQGAMTSKPAGGIKFPTGFFYEAEIKGCP